MASFLDENGLRYFWQKIKSAFVSKESGKGLSTNDYTTTEKNKLANIEAGAQKNVKPDWNASSGEAAEILNKPTIPTSTSDLVNDSGFITTGDIPEGAAASTTVPKMDGVASVGTELAFARGDHVHPHDNTKADASNVYTKSQVYTKTEIDKMGFATDADLENKADKSTTLNGYGITDAYTKTQTDAKVNGKADKSTTLNGYGITDAYTKTEVDGKISSVYKPAGNSTFAHLPNPSASNLGFVYSLTDAFTTDNRFVEGTGKDYPIGTNVVVVDTGSATYKYDVLAGFVDLSNYLQTSDVTAIQNGDIDDIVSA